MRPHRQRGRGPPPIRVPVGPEPRAGGPGSSAAARGPFAAWVLSLIHI
ncbi:hypothetical protein [Streptomyces sp. st170]|nr:hypothetical protein [Streptomyces sp. st170]